MDLDRQPTLEGPKLKLEPLGPSHRISFLAVASDPLIWEEHPESDRGATDKVERFFEDSLASGGALVVINGDGDIIGSSRFEEPDEEKGRVLVDHTFLARTYWDREHYVEVKKLLFDHAFEAVETVELRIGVENGRTRRAVEDFLGGVYVETVSTPLGDHAVYEISRDAWAQRG